MAPNAEEELLEVKSWNPPSAKERLQPPTYNAEDYAIALRRWGRRPLGSIQDSQSTLPSTISSGSGYAHGNNGGEMTLRQFTSLSELLNKLRVDLRLAFPSFVEEFVSPPAEGITLLLETLRGIQLAQNSPPTSSHTGARRGSRRAALDELGCVECLASCGERCPDASRLLVQAQPGLLALAVCLTSSLNRSRVLALQILTKVCQTSGGHAVVSEAFSTLRLKYGEGGRFRFLSGALMASRAAMPLRLAGVSFLNAFLESAERTQTRLYIQAEACEAGLEPKALGQWLNELNDRDEELPTTEQLRKEIDNWMNNCVDVDGLRKRVIQAEETCKLLNNKIFVLESELEKLQLEKLNNDYNLNKSISKETKDKVFSSNAEDEGISSSQRSSSPEEGSRGREDLNKRATVMVQDNQDRETTIDDVIEELRIIVKDAEEKFDDERRDSHVKEEKSCPKKFIITKPVESFNDRDSNGVTYFGNGRNGDEMIEASVRIVVKAPDVEEAIIPTILYPQPPRRTSSCLAAMMAVRNHGDFIDDEEIELETLGDGSDSLLTASRLKYNQTSGLNYVRSQRNSLVIPLGNTNNESEGLIRRRIEAYEELETPKESRHKNSFTTGKVESQIKRFENRPVTNKGFPENNIKSSNIRRSESLHQVSHELKRNYSHNTTKSDSDKSHVYSTNLNFDRSKSPRLLTKSLDRIDETLDTMIDIVNAKKHDGKGKSMIFNNESMSSTMLKTGLRHHSNHNDNFGLPKSGFNAIIKYNHGIRDNPFGRKNTTSYLVGKCGKVTDVVSGLY